MTLVDSELDSKFPISKLSDLRELHIPDKHRKISLISDLCSIHQCRITPDFLRLLQYFLQPPKGWQEYMQPGTMRKQELETLKTSALDMLGDDKAWVEDEMEVLIWLFYYMKPHEAREASNFCQFITALIAQLKREARRSSTYGKRTVLFADTRLVPDQENLSEVSLSGEGVILVGKTSISLPMFRHLTLRLAIKALAEMQSNPGSAIDRIRATALIEYSRSVLNAPDQQSIQPIIDAFELALNGELSLKIRSEDPVRVTKTTVSSRKKKNNALVPLEVAKEFGIIADIAFIYSYASKPDEDQRKVSVDAVGFLNKVMQLLGYEWDTDQEMFVREKSEAKIDSTGSRFNARVRD